jgi:hypothetical protein
MCKGFTGDGMYTANCIIHQEDDGTTGGTNASGTKPIFEGTHVTELEFW